MKTKLTLLGAAFVCAALGAFIHYSSRGRSMKNTQLEVLRTSFRKIDELPDPAIINTAGKWYLLNHISSPVIEYDHQTSSFKPLIAEKWEINGSRYIFHLNAKAKFSDGSPIKASDVAQTIKRILTKRQSTHFPLWKHVLGCETLTKLSEDCEGIKWDDKRGVVEVNLKGKSDSFLLQVSSPESGIWSADDMNAETLELSPKKFSGPYALENLKVNDNRELVLTRNEFSLIQESFPLSPKKILIRSMERADIEKAIVSREADVFIGDFIPYNEYDWEQMNVSVHHTTPSSIIYFFGLNSKEKIGLDLLESLSETPEKRMIRAKAFLPFAPVMALNEEEVHDLVPKKSSRRLHIAAPGFYFKDKTLEFIESAAWKSGIDLKITKIDRAELFTLLTSKEDYRGPYDFILGSYVASERYPAVQLRFLTGARTSPVDLGDVEQPDQDPAKIARLKDYQKWLLSSQTVVPVYFVRSHIVSNPTLDIGKQPTTEADLQLWRITQKAAQ